ncbi:hypothetical protein [Actinosynnema mirum]|uniref:hypothetical protein n=1 Tax=Actinosynnema mirum TaxID=40567 RepID=UPI00019AB25F|nr:hypothetical protein [Actinosynnema mirum]
MKDSELRRHRERPVPAEVDPSGRALYRAHIRLGQGDGAPRLFFLDATGTGGSVCVGYAGRHLPLR